MLYYRLLQFRLQDMRRRTRLGVERNQMSLWKKKKRIRVVQDGRLQLSAALEAFIHVSRLIDVI